MISPFPRFCFTFGHLSHGISWAHDQMTVSQHSKSEGLHHRVGRVISFSPVVGIGTTPTPHPQVSVPLPLWFRGEGRTRWRERGWESPNSDVGTYTVVLFIHIYVLCGLHTSLLPSLPSPSSLFCNLCIKELCLSVSPTSPTMSKLFSPLCSYYDFRTVD
jgi:hypothetical protein